MPRLRRNLARPSNAKPEAPPQLRCIDNDSSEALPNVPHGHAVPRYVTAPIGLLVRDVWWLVPSFLRKRASARNVSDSLVNPVARAA
jgi:hypothetical protein